MKKITPVIKTRGFATQQSKRLSENMEALKHNFLFRGYFRRKAKEEEKLRKAAENDMKKTVENEK